MDAAPFQVPAPERTAEALAAVVALRRLADQLEYEAVDHAVAEGWTWAQLADALGVSRQAVHKRHAKRINQRMKETRS
ncbi:MAG: helix-turn-helix domain-containing protein [Acidimicrobiales bacterium]